MATVSPGLAPLSAAPEADEHPALKVADSIQAKAESMLRRKNSPGYQGMMTARRMVVFGLVELDINLDESMTFEVSTWMNTSV